MAHDDIERFETAAAKKLRLLRASKVYSYVILRIRLPGGVFLQGRFSLQESLKVKGLEKILIYLIKGVVFKLRGPPESFWPVASLSISGDCFLSCSSYMKCLYRTADICRQGHFGGI